MKFSINNLFLLILSLFIFVSCNKEPKVKIEGEFSLAENGMLYLMHRDLDGIKMLDSVELKRNGKFKFEIDVPKNPEFYQLQLNSQVVVFTVFDNKNISIKGDAKDLVNTFKVENSPENDQLHQIDVITQDIKSKIKDLDDGYSANSITDLEYVERFDSLLTNCKSDLSQIIISNPSSGAAYYALFQKIDDYLIFDPLQRKDYGMYGAVATSWKQHYEGTPRYEHLSQFAMSALKTRKQKEKQDIMLENIEVITEAVAPEIKLSNIRGQDVKLSDLKGKTVLLDFTLYNSEFSPAHNMALNSVYEKFKAKGFEIYQISFDSDEHLWKNAANNLPWITVRDAESVYSSLLPLYNVRNLPTTFIIDKNGNPALRVENYAELEREIRRIGLF